VAGGIVSALPDGGVQVDSALTFDKTANLVTVDGPVRSTTAGQKTTQLEPYVMTGNAGGSFCAFGGIVPEAEVVSRCSDEDGCTLRLISERNGARYVLGPIAFSYDAVSHQYFVGGGGTALGTNMDATFSTPIIGDASNFCRFADWDSSNADANLNFALVVCPNSVATTCKFRIDD
jgi:hypothetical protein